MKNFFYLMLLVSLPIFAHPHHHSLALISYNIESQQFELSLKLLSEDYAAIKTKESLNKYVNSHFTIKPETQTLKGKLAGTEKAYEFVWLYFTFAYSMPKNLKSTSIKNTLLLEINASQFNTVKINLMDQQKAHNFSSSNKKYIFTFK